MPPFHDTVTVSKGIWKQLTAGDVVKINLQNLSNDPVWIKPTVGAVPPLDQKGAWRLQPYQAISANIDDLAEGLPGANRLYAWSDDGAAIIVTHG